MSQLVEKTLSSEIAFKGRFLVMKHDEVLCPDGKERGREYIVHPGAALVIPILPDGRFAMVRQYRHAVGQVFLEFPAGKLDPGEEPLGAAKRELREETGYEAAEIGFLGRIHPCIGYSNEFIDIFAAAGLTQKGAKPDPGEALEHAVYSYEELKVMARRGELTDAKTLSALFYFEQALARKSS